MRSSYVHIFSVVVCVLLFPEFRTDAQSVQVINASGVPFSLTGSAFVFPVGETTFALSPLFCSAWNADVMGLTLGQMDLTNDFCLLASTVGGSLASYPSGQVSLGVNAYVGPSNLVDGMTAAFTVPSVWNSWQGGLWLGAVVVASLFGFSFIRAIPGGNREDM